MFLVGSFYWIRYGKLIDSKLGGEQRPVPRIFGRPFELRAGSALSPTQLVQRLNDVGYAERPKVEGPGEFNVAGQQRHRRARDRPARPSRRPCAWTSRAGAAPVVTKLTDRRRRDDVDSVALEAPLLAALAPGEKRRYVPLASDSRRSW